MFLQPSGALREANPGSPQPIIPVTYEADPGPIFGSRDARDQRCFRAVRPSLRIFPQESIADGFKGLLIQRLAKSAYPRNFKLAFWRWTGPKCKLDVVNGEGRLFRF